MLSHLLLVCIWTASIAAAQDDGQAAERLATLVNGTVPNSDLFRAQSTSITSNNRLGLLNVAKARSTAQSSMLHMQCRMTH